MPDTTVQLQVKAAQNPVPAGFTTCQNNSGYMYKYTGGNAGQNNGSFNFSHGSGSKSVQIGLNASSGFSISNLTINYDNGSDPQDLSSNSNADGTWTITDSDVDAESGSYNVFVNDNNISPPVAGIECDPRWTNN